MQDENNRYLFAVIERQKAELDAMRERAELAETRLKALSDLIRQAGDMEELLRASRPT